MTDSTHSSVFRKGLDLIHTISSENVGLVSLGKVIFSKKDFHFTSLNMFHTCFYVPFSLLFQVLDKNFQVFALALTCAALYSLHKSVTSILSCPFPPPSQTVAGTTQLPSPNRHNHEKFKSFPSSPLGINYNGDFVVDDNEKEEESSKKIET